MASSYPSTILTAYRRLFRKDPEVVVRAPGRINLMGGHVDYNDGLVLPMAVPYYIYTALGRTDEPEADFLAMDLGLRSRFPLTRLERLPHSRIEWVDYVKGTMEQLRRRGLAISGCTGVIGGDLRREAGLGSSAALEISVALALERLFAPYEKPKNLAEIAHLAETQYVGVRCGVMDSYASFYCREDHLLLLDCRSLAMRHIPLRLSGHRILICVTPAHRRLADSAYNERRRECENIVSLLRRNGLDIQSLRDLPPEALKDVSGMMTSSLFPRCRHVVTEIERVGQTIQSLKAGDLNRVGSLMNDSFKSLRDDYQVTIPALDRFFERMSRETGVHGIRLTGAGFGGCVIMLAEAPRVEPIKKAIGAFASREFGQPVEVLAAIPVAGAAACRSEADG